MKTNKGFSLVELIIVIAIIGIVLAIASPSFYKYRQNTNLKEATRELAGDITLYRQTAIAQNVRYRIVFNQLTNSYTIQIESPANSGTYVDVLTKSPASVSSSVIIMGGANFPSFTGGVAYITIQPRGTMSAGTVWLQHTGRLSTSTITTNLMGKVNVTYDLKY
ncbi:MAG: prepilin-type N-terminal cleavage/methylation domain-containing protein [Syntrophaceae bacterium]|nr:prepilin-type N-terminal cleavage/methylation domain-containing protein [Syntrophaceae bacterium]